MTECSEYIKAEFPMIDDDLKQYVEGEQIDHNDMQHVTNVTYFADVLSNGADDFEDSEEVYDAVGDLLQEVAGNKTEEEIRLDFKL